MTALSGSVHPRLRVETITDGDTTQVVIRGEADVADVDQLDAALTRIQLNGARSVHINACDLDFFDVAVLRRLTAFAHMVKQTGRDITTCGATPMLNDVARVLEFHDELGLHGPGPIVP